MKRRYSKEEKLQIVKESLEEGTTLLEVASRYGLHANTIGKWRRQMNLYGETAFPGKGKSLKSEEEREIERLRKELRESQLANEILKKAMGIIVSPSRKNLLS